MIKARTLAAFILVLAVAGSWAQTTGRVEGRVHGPDGSPVEKAEVTIVSQRTSSIHFDLKTDKDGRFIQVGLAPGQYLVSAKKAGFAPSSKEIRIKIAEETTCEFTLEPVETSHAEGPVRSRPGIPERQQALRRAEIRRGRGRLR